VLTNNLSNPSLLLVNSQLTCVRTIFTQRERLLAGKYTNVKMLYSGRVDYDVSLLDDSNIIFCDCWAARWCVPHFSTRLWDWDLYPPCRRDISCCAPHVDDIAGTATDVEDPSETELTTSQKLEPAGPPVGPSDRRDVEIESIGEQGDGSAKIDRSYVVIVPDTEVGMRNNGDQ